MGKNINCGLCKLWYFIWMILVIKNQISRILISIFWNILGFITDDLSNIDPFVCSYVFIWEKPFSVAFLWTHRNTTVDNFYSMLSSFSPFNNKFLKVTNNFVMLSEVEDDFSDILHITFGFYILDMSILITFEFNTLMYAVGFAHLKKEEDLMWEGSH